VYTYKTDSPLIDKIEYKQNSTVQARITRAYEAKLDLLKSIQNEELLSGGSPVTVSKYTYAHDVLNRRTSVVRAGSAFAASHHDAWGYNERNELTSSDRYNNTDPNNPTDPNHALDRGYVYDPIGNRKNHTEGTGAATYYCVNQLNEYQSLTSGVQCPPGQGQEIELFDYDEDGNITQDDTHDYTWDAENRLIRVEPKGAPQNGDKKLEFIYDYLGRRVERTLSTYSASAWSVTDRRRFIYYNWLCLVEYSVDGSGDLDDVLYKYSWGLDLGGSGANPQVDTAGGIGGLLACRDVGASKNYFYFYDGNGNVGQLVDRADGSIDAKYEYDAYGNTIIKSGAFADDNPYRFSTKYFDEASSLYYYGYRYYSPRLGRWLNRDPIEERSFETLLDLLGQSVPTHDFSQISPTNFRLASEWLRLAFASAEACYSFVGNAPSVHTDFLGLAYNTCTLKQQRCTSLRKKWVFPFRIIWCVQRKCWWRCWCPDPGNCYRVPCRLGCDRNHGVEEFRIYGPELQFPFGMVAPLCHERVQRVINSGQCGCDDDGGIDDDNDD